MGSRRKQNGGAYMVKNGERFSLSHTTDKPIPISRKYRVVDAVKMGMHYDWSKPLPFSTLNIPFDCGRQFDVIDIDDKTDRKTFYATYPQFGSENAKYERDYLCVLPIRATTLFAAEIEITSRNEIQWRGVFDEKQWFGKDGKGGEFAALKKLTKHIEVLEPIEASLLSEVAAQMAMSQYRVRQLEADLNWYREQNSILKQESELHKVYGKRRARP